MTELQTEELGPMDQDLEQFSVFVLTEAGWFLLGEKLTWEEAMLRAELANDEINCIVQVRDAEEVIVDQMGELIAQSAF